MSADFRSGFVAFIGRPNVGKSTLLNQIIGQKIAIMSPKAQTTRNKIQGIYTTEEEQIIFIDTPGIHKPQSKLDDFMVESAYSALHEVNVVCFLINAEQKLGPGDKFIMDRLKAIETPVFLVVNKIDKVHPNDLLPIIEEYTNYMSFAEVIPISAKNGNNVDTLLNQLSKNLELGPMYYPKDQITDHPEYFITAELIREKILQFTEEEVPHSVAVSVEQMQLDPYDKIHVMASIIVERDGQKGIIIGKQGQMLKKIGTAARKEIELLLGNKVYLELHVKVKKNWRDREGLLQNFGYHPEID